MVAAGLAVRSLAKSYGRPPNQVIAVNGISFQVGPGECFGLLGPNGAGKSTSIDCITGLYPPTSGQVLINGFDVFSEPRKARLLLGVCSQEDTLDTDFVVIKQLIRYATFFRISPKQSLARAEALLQQLNLSEFRDESVESLSGGTRRRLQVARALISDPAVIILDEPTTGLDPDARRLLWEVLQTERGRGKAILLSTHYMDEAERLCDHIAILHRGKILAIDTPQNLIKDHIGYETIEETIRPAVSWKRPPNLEDVFMKLAGTRLETATE